MGIKMENGERKTGKRKWVIAGFLLSAAVCLFFVAKFRDQYGEGYINAFREMKWE